MMKRQKGFTLVELAYVVFLAAMMTGWVMNIIKLTRCDFVAPYKAEVIHTVGLVPLIGMVTGWLDVGK